jgi:hypothetical protein
MKNDQASVDYSLRILSYTEATSVYQQSGGVYSSRSCLAQVPVADFVFADGGNICAATLGKPSGISTTSTCTGALLYGQGACNNNNDKLFIA